MEERIMEVVGFYGLERMPTESECKRYFGNSSLTNKVSRTTGWYKLADSLGLPVKDSETTNGKRWEAYAEKELAERGHSVEKTTQNHPYDLVVDGCVKIDVKASNLYRKDNIGFWTYGIAKKYCTCDIYMLYMEGSESGEHRVLIVPGVTVFNNRQISVGEYDSKYYKYLDRWDIIDDYSHTLKNFATVYKAD